MSFQIFYKKRTNLELFKNIEALDIASQIQNYIPIYERFFALNNTNYNNVNLNNTFGVGWCF